MNEIKREGHSFNLRSSQVGLKSEGLAKEAEWIPSAYLKHSQITHNTLAALLKGFISKY